MRRSMRLALVAIVVLGGWTVVSASEVISLAPSVTGVEFAPGENGIIHLQVSEVRLDRIEIAGDDWAVIRVPGGHNLMDRGLPSLPYLSSEYLLDRTGGIALELVSTKLREIDLDSHGVVGVAPSKGHFDRTIDPSGVPWVFDDKIYQDADRYPAEDVWVDRPHIAGPLRGQALRFPVTHWRPDTNTLAVVEEAWFRVVVLSKADNPRVGPDRPLTGLFDAVARLHAINYDVIRGRYTSFVETGRLVIIADDAFIDEVQPLADWETLVGYPTSLMPVSVAGSTDCDPCYTKLEGADNRPDASISRISAQTEAQVTVQVNKILDYERWPDTGSAGAWYAKAFGVAFDGGTPPDWERMNWLRDDLLTPAYHFTEFDQIYDPSATAAQVSAAVNAGRSLGLYIGHGSKTAWSTSGFSVTDINNMLTNSETLPIIWSVACVNGDFTEGGDCFAEAWLKKDGGGAVSFEGATTNESWVPPCDAQRGIIDALREETAFTTGGQHVNGKLFCMDVNGDSNSDEGTKFMEQSTLFGAATMWPRTLPAVAPDEPDDFVSAGGVATLTVKVGGAPMTQAGGAIVSFYDETGGVNIVGSGLIDAGGVVTAAVIGDPTHCHIHGRNLVPMSFELAAREAGRVSLDGGAYACGNTVTVRVADSNIPGSSPATIDTTTADLSVGGAPYTVTLTEIAADRNVFVGTVVLGTDLVVSHGDTLLATYIDVNDGAGGVSVPRTADAAIDCQGPAISNIQATATESSVTFSFTTDEPGTTVVVYGTTTPPATVVSDTALTTGHQITVEGIDPCTTYSFEVRSVDALGNLSADNNGGTYYAVNVAGWGTFFSETFDSDPGWYVDNGSFSSTGWAYGQPTGQGQDIYGGPDPTAGFTGLNAYGINLDGDAPANAGDNEIRLTTPVIDLSTATTAQLRFRRWLGVERDYYDHARIRLSIDGGASWQTVWKNEGTTIDDQAWIEQIIELPQAVGHDQVQIRWTHGASDGSWNYCGWNIDDVVVEGAVPCGSMNSVFDDGFESGGCTMWSQVVGES